MWTWWVLLNPNVEESEKPLILKLAFTELFAVVGGTQPLREQWTLPACMVP